MTHHPDETPDKARLLAMLREDTGSSDNAETLLPLIMQMRMQMKQTAGLSDEAKVNRFAQRAIAELHASQQRHQQRQQSALRRLQAWYPFVLLKVQLRIVQTEIWIASALVMLIGGAVTIQMTSSRTYSGELPLVLLAPIVAAVGISFLYSSDVEEAMEIERTTPTSPQVILLLRLMLVFCFNFSLGIVSSLVLTVVNPAYSLAPLIMMWLAPMAFLSSLAFFLSVIFVDAGAGMIVSMMLWTIQVLNRFLARSGFNTFPVPDMLSATAHVWMLVFATGLLATALWISQRKHWVGRDSS